MKRVSVRRVLGGVLDLIRVCVCVFKEGRKPKGKTINTALLSLSFPPRQTRV